MTIPDSGAAVPPPPPVPASPSPPRDLRLGDLLVVVGALTVFAFSFAPFVEYGQRAQQELFALVDVSPQFNAWSLQTFMVPLTTFVVVAALLGIVAVAARFALRRDPNLLGFRLRQLEVGLALFGFAVLLGMVASDKYAVIGARRLADADPAFRLEDVALDTGWGAVLMLIGTVVALVGALLNHFSVGPTFSVGAGATPPPPAGYGPWQDAPTQPAGGWQGGPAQPSSGWAAPPPPGTGPGGPPADQPPSPPPPAGPTPPR
jgi:hypothetical protein